MSSMFKKKGGLAFKPKIPSARSRPANVPSAPTPKSAESRPTLVDPTLDPTLDAVSANAAEPSPNSPPPAAVPSFQSRTARDSPGQSSHKSPEPAHRTIEQQPSPEARPRASSVARRASASSTGAAPGTAPTVNDGVTTQADTSSQPATGCETTAAQAPKPATALPSLSSSGTSSESPAEDRPSRELHREASSQSTQDVATHVSSDASEPPPSTATTTPAPASAAKPSGTKKKRGKGAQNPKDGDENTNRPQKRQRKKAPQQGTNATPRPRTRKRQADAATDDGSETQKKPRRARSATPEDAEDQVVDLQQLRMADLTKDLRIGKKFSRHDELRDRERQARNKAKPPQDEDQPDGAASGSASPKPDGPASSTGSNPASSSAPATSGPQFRIVDGQIVIDQSSLVMNRHARAAAAQARGDMETVEENDFTRLITSSSFMNTSKLKGPNIWTEPETELFYRGLRMFGTEFEMISKMFPGKQRRHVKLKFNREERHNPARIDAALIGEKTIKMDLDEYRAFTGADFEPVEAIEAEQRKIELDYEAERQRIADEQAELMRKKREELFADDDDDDAAGRKKRRGRRSGKQAAVAYGLNGEPITQAG